jgi:hypothetical protein
MKILKRFLWFIVMVLYITPGAAILMPLWGINKYVENFDIFVKNLE